MAVDDIVRTIRDIRTFDPETLKIRPDGIPRGSLGSIFVENNADRFISVQFEFIREGLQKITKIVGVFAEDTVDTIANSLEFITVEPAPELIAEIREASTVGLESRDDLAIQSEPPAGLPRPPRPGDRTITLPSGQSITIGNRLSGGTFGSPRVSVRDFVPDGLTVSFEFDGGFTLAPNTALPSGFEFIPASRNDDQVRRIGDTTPQLDASEARRRLIASGDPSAIEAEERRVARLAAPRFFARSEDLVSFVPGDEPENIQEAVTFHNVPAEVSTDES